MSAGLRESNQLLPQGSRHDAVRYYGWSTGKGIKIALVTTDYAVKLGARVTDKYEWDQVAACFKTKFILDIFEKLVIIMTDGTYIVIKGSVAELIEAGGTFSPYITESRTGGSAFDEIYTQFAEVAKVKTISPVPQTCLKETPYITLILLALPVMAIGLFGLTLITLTASLLLLIVLLYELYCLRNLNSLAEDLKTGIAGKG